MELITNEQIDNSNISSDAKMILKIISPVLTNTSTIQIILNDILNNDDLHNKLTDSIKEILVGTQEKLSLGEGPGGLKGDINKIIKTTSVSKNLQNQDICTIEEVLLYIQNSNKEGIKEIKEILTAKVHWTKNIQGIKDVVMSIGILITALLTVYGTFIK